MYTSSVNPPIPSSQLSDGTGQRLLSLLRNHDKEEDLDSLGEIVNHMQLLVASVQRRGLLQGDIKLAEQVLANCSNASTTSSASKSRKIRKRDRAKGNSDLTIHTDSNIDAPQKTASLDVQLLMSALARIFDKHGDVLVTALASDVVTAACECTKSRAAADSCFLAEYELLASNGKIYLAGLEKYVREILSKLDAGAGGLYQASGCDDDESMYCIAACLRAAAALVSLFGTKLSRSTAILKGLQEVSWKALFVVDDGVVKATTTLLATLPFAGGTDRATPASLWNDAVADTVSALSNFTQTVAPVAKGKQVASGNMDIASARTSESMQKVLDLCTSNIREAHSEGLKTQLFLQLSKGLVSLITSLLAREAIGIAGASVSSTREQLGGTEVDVASMLYLIERMLSFSAAAESKYYITKKRLRQEAVDGGLLSPASLAGVVANCIRLLGHNLLDSMISALGASALLPYARRVIKVSCSALQASCSTTLRKVLDPVGAMHMEGKKRRWLHMSVSVRTAAVRTFCKVVHAVGTDPLSMSSLTSESSRSSHAASVDRAITIVCGYIVETYSPDTAQNLSEEWGSLDDRVRIVATSGECLAASLNSGGEYLQATTRGLVDSVACTCLSLLVTQDDPISSFGAVKASILAFGSAAACTPWQDGASSAIAGNLKTAARACQQDRDAAVALAATAAIRTCEALECPRIPALNVVVRSDACLKSEPAGKAFTAKSVAEKLQTAREEMERSRAREEAEKAAGSSNPQKKAKKSEPLTTKPVTEKANDETEPAERTAGPPQIEGAPPPVNASSTTNTNEEADRTGLTLNEAEGKVVLNSATQVVEESMAQTEDADDEDELGDFPMIVDCEPDKDDV